MTSWLFKIVERECYRLFRRTKPTVSFDEIFIENEYGVTQDTSLEIDLIQSLTALPTHYREVLILRDIEEFTAPEVAKKLGITVEAVKSRLHRARTMVREDLTRRGYRQQNQTHSVKG